MEPAVRKRALIATLLVLAIAPLFVALVVVATDGWRPLGDDAVIGVFSHDVLSTDTPLVGMPSTIGLHEEASIDAHHPGPLAFWALAGPERLTGSAPIGLLVGAALVNAVAIATIGLVAWRIAGIGAAAAILGLVALLVWALGRQALVSPWNPHLALLPMLAMLLLAWGTLAGRARWLWAVSLFASFVAQAHLVYIPVAAVAFACGAGGAAVTLAQRARRGRPWKREAVVVVAGTAAALIAAWLFPIVDELVHSPGNVTLLRDSWEANTDVGAGTGYAARFLVEAIGATPLFARQAASIEGIAPPWSQMSPLRIVSAVAILVALVGGTVLAVRRRDRIAAAAGGLALSSVVTMGFVVARLTLDFGGVLRYRLLQGWIVGCFVWFATGVVLARGIAPSLPTIDAHRRRVVRTIGVATAVCALLVVAVAIGNADSDAPADPRLFDAVDRVADGMEPHLSRADHYRFELSTGRAIASLDAYYGTLRELMRRGFDVGVASDDPYLARAHTAPEDAARLVLVIGRDAAAPPESRARRITDVALATPADIRRAEQSADDLRVYLRNEARLTDKGRQALVSPTPAGDETASALEALHAGSVDPIMLVDNGQIDALVLAGYLDTEVPGSEPYRAYAEARYLVDDLVYAAYLVP